MEQIKNGYLKEDFFYTVNEADNLIDTTSEVERNQSQKPSLFDPDKYLELNPDVREARTNPYEYYHRCGKVEGRKIL